MLYYNMPMHPICIPKLALSILIRNVVLGKHRMHDELVLASSRFPSRVIDISGDLKLLPPQH
jgi:hypothetical protein